MGQLTKSNINGITKFLNCHIGEGKERTKYIRISYIFLELFLFLSLLLFFIICFLLYYIIVYCHFE